MHVRIIPPRGQRFRDIADSVKAYLMVDMAHVAGLIAAGIYPNPTQIAPYRSAGAAK